MKLQKNTPPDKKILRNVRGTLNESSYQHCRNTCIIVFLHVYIFKHIGYNICHELESSSSQSCFEENTRWLTPRTCSCILFKISTQYAFLQFSMSRFVHLKTRVNIVIGFGSVGSDVITHIGMSTEKNIPVFSVILEFCNHLANVECQFFVNLLIWKKGF